MRRKIFVATPAALIKGGFCLLLFANPVVLTAQDEVLFNRDVRPILSNNCFHCHGFDPNTREAELRIDTFAGATAELNSGEGFAIVPGKPDESVLFRRMSSHDSDLQMPPQDSGKQLTEAQIEVVRRWIQSGAKYERHWSFVPPKAVALPRVNQTGWVRNEIDNYVLRRLEALELSPSHEADRRTLIRRVSLDTTGLPPSLVEIQRFLSDESDDAYETMVDYYLASPRYGEHMARLWLDLARYADTSGYQYDRERKMWVWRDWVINAYNQNMPFDQFTVEQLAGDLIPGATPQQILATGFNRNHPITIEGGVIDEEYRTEYVIDRLTTTSTAWLGLTVGCARCHDHKFDPISQKEFYQMADFFNQVDEKGLNGFQPMMKIASPLAKPLGEAEQKQIEILSSRLRQLGRTPSTDEFQQWTKSVAESGVDWRVLEPVKLKSSGGSTLTVQADLSFVAGGANPQKDIYEIVATTNMEAIQSVMLECLMDKSLPGGGPGRHTNSNFVLSEFELDVVSLNNPSQKSTVKFAKAQADYSQKNYGIELAIDGTVNGNNGWAVDGPTRKQPATALFVASKPFGFEGGSKLIFRLRHEAGFQTHGIGRPRLSITTSLVDSLDAMLTSPRVQQLASKPLNTRTREESEYLKTQFEQVRKHSFAEVQKEIARLESANSYPATMVMRDRTTRRKTYLLRLGQYDRPGIEVQADVPSALGAMDPDAPANRLGFARWLVSPEHPLTARVAVNRYWQQLFGVGFVKTSEDFGFQGEWPSHPELLDTLAYRFVESGWDVKAMLRLMLTSATYRQSAQADVAARERDPENRLLARGPRFRLDAEQIRDSALAISGLLKEHVGGPSVYPYQPEGLWLELNNRPGYSRAYEVGDGDALYRRSMYTYWKRTVLSPMLTTFDAPGREFCTVRRSRTNTPLQSLLMLQGPQYVEAARHLAVRMMTDGGADIQSRIRHGFELATSRIPTDEELKIMTTFYEDRFSAFQSHPESAKRLLAVGKSSLDSQLDPVKQAAWLEIARLILNLDEVITKG